MLQYEMNGNVLHVTSRQLSFFKTEVRHWYYDVVNWIKSSHGREGDTPDREMSPDDIAWVKKYYLPKVA